MALSRPRRLSDRLAARALVLAIDPRCSARTAVESLVRLSRGNGDQLSRAERQLAARRRQNTEQARSIDRAVDLLAAARCRTLGHLA